MSRFAVPVLVLAFGCTGPYEPDWSAQFGDPGALRQLGASLYIDSQAQDPAAELLKLGGAKVVLATATSGEAISAMQAGLAVNGTLLVLGAATSMQVSPLVLLAGRRSIKG